MSNSKDKYSLLKPNQKSSQKKKKDGIAITTSPSSPPQNYPPNHSQITFRNEIPCAKTETTHQYSVFPSDIVFRKTFAQKPNNNENHLSMAADLYKRSD